MYLESYKDNSRHVLLVDNSNQINFQEAWADHRWKQATTVEMNAHDRNKTWDLVSLPLGAKM